MQFRSILETHAELTFLHTHTHTHTYHLGNTTTHLRQSVVCAGESVYLPERERILGQKSKVTARLADRAARRSQALALAYATSMAASFLMILADSLARSKLA